jgi:hypothetical protein
MPETKRGVILDEGLRSDARFMRRFGKFVADQPGQKDVTVLQSDHVNRNAILNLVGSDIIVMGRDAYRSFQSFKAECN